MATTRAVLVLHVNGSYTVPRIATTHAAIMALLKHCRTTTPLLTRPDEESFYRRIECVRGYLDNEAATKCGMSEWTELLDALGLMDNSVGCLFGDIVLTHTDATKDVPIALIHEVEVYHAIVQENDAHRKWGHIKQLTIRYGLRRKCQWHACKNTDSHQQCGKCNSVMYCSRECQKLDWPMHRDDCDGITDDNCKQQ